MQKKTKKRKNRSSAKEAGKVSYKAFLQRKMAVASNTGFTVKKDELTPSLFPHVKDTVIWAI